MRNVACQICGNFTLAEYGSFDICPVCFWQDDGVYDNPDEVEGGPNGDLSLTQARKNYKEFGVCNKEMIEHVRPPTESELPSNN